MSVYSMDFDAMLYRLKDLEKSYNAELKLLESHAPGCLYGVKRDGRQNYLQTQIINGKQQRHGITNDPDTLRRLCRKAYLREALENVRENINCIATVKLQCMSLQPAEITAKVKAWIEEPYEQSTFMPEKKVHITSRGEKMRSKNEVLHAETMYRLGIPFRYEPVLHIGNRELIPDKKPVNPKVFRLFLFLHIIVRFI